MNQFLVFDENGTNCTSQELYDVDPERLDGVARGRARSDLYNKAMRQATLMANALGQLISDNGQDALESGSLKSQLQNAIQNIVSSYVATFQHPDLQGDETVTFPTNGVQVAYAAGGKEVTTFNASNIVTVQKDKSDNTIQTITTVFNANGSISVTYTKPAA